MKTKENTYKTMWDLKEEDETGVNWKDLPRKSLVSKRDSKVPDFTFSKERVKAVDCADASGTHSLRFIVIGKSKKPRNFINVSCIPILCKAQNDVIYLPPNVTALVQPMEQYVMEKLKRIYRKRGLQISCSVAAIAEKLNMEDAFYMLAEAWDSP
ncbi:HTH CENPB-type domain-containing protein [Trichonephila clavipes]|nr:HTH CENPB-type domain-containing protein [Trichonephila clavipes]